MNRKKFLQQSSVIGFGLAMNPSNLIPYKKKPLISAIKPSNGKKVIVAGAGIAGLCCGYELMKRGFDVSVLDADGRHGGHVFTGRDGLSDGLYVDYGAEGFTKPGYEKFWEYIDEFDLPVLKYQHRINRLSRIDDHYYTDEEVWSRQFDRAKELGGFNEKERRFLSSNPVWNLETLYLQPYWEKFSSDYHPLGVGLDDLDHISVSELYEKDGASQAALDRLGGSRTSALFKIWQSYILHVRGIPLYHPDMLYRIEGGNQKMTDAFASRLGERVLLDCRITEVEHGNSGVKVIYEEFGETRVMEADYLANCLPVPALRNILFTPDVPTEKRYIFDNLAYDSYPRFAFQARSKFWLNDNLPINFNFNHPGLNNVWQVANEVDTQRVVLMATGPGGTSPLRALHTFKQLYPGNTSNITIEQALVKDWTADRFAPSCERLSFPMGTLAKFWPHVMTPVGRIHFAGSYADNNNWGMEAATNSANRVAEEIEQA
jgi:monoamine oxidase